MACTPFGRPPSAVRHIISPSQPLHFVVLETARPPLPLSPRCQTRLQTLPVVIAYCNFLACPAVEKSSDGSVISAYDYTVNAIGQRERVERMGSAFSDFNATQYSVSNNAPHTSVLKYYPTYDGNGNVSEYLDSTGVSVAHYEQCEPSSILDRSVVTCPQGQNAKDECFDQYDAFGNEIDSKTTGTKANDFAHRFSTKTLDSETGFYYYGYRYYNPVTGTWPSRDPIGENRITGELNLYALAKNNGINNWDYFGLCSEGQADFPGGGSVNAVPFSETIDDSDKNPDGPLKKLLKNSGAKKRINPNNMDDALFGWEAKLNWRCCICNETDGKGKWGKTETESGSSGATPSASKLSAKHAGDDWLFKMKVGIKVKCKGRMLMKCINLFLCVVIASCECLENEKSFYRNHYKMEVVFSNAYLGVGNDSDYERKKMMENFFRLYLVDKTYTKRLFKIISSDRVIITEHEDLLGLEYFYTHEDRFLDVKEHGKDKNMISFCIGGTVVKTVFMDKEIVSYFKSKESYFKLCNEFRLLDEL